jgi:2'-5' RNA ligase
MAKRLFVAWPLDDAIRREIGRIASPLRTQLPAASWSRPESIHLTFAFLGEMADDRVASLARALDGCADGAGIEVRAGAVGFFPGERRPRVAWIGIEPSEPVEALAVRVRGALLAVGAHVDAKPFRPHLTLARIKAPWRAADVGALRDAFRGWTSPPARLDQIVLYESRLSSAGAVHSPLHSVALG